MSAKINRRESAAIINSLSAGVVPRIGLRHMAVGRKKEIESFLNDLKTIEDGGAAFRFICGKYGSGKSFLLQLVRNNALDRNFVVMDADLSPERRFYGSNGRGLATYRELMQHISTRVRPEGGALESILQKWINNLQIKLSQENNLELDSPALIDLVNSKILSELSELTEMSHGYSFSKVISAYWLGTKTDNYDLKKESIRWLYGEYNSRREARKTLGVDSIIDDTNWYDFLKVFALFIKIVGYKGLVMFIDEGVNLYKITHKINRESNYEKILTIFNDMMQGKARYIGLFLSETPESIYDDKRGLYSYDALRTRLAQNQYQTGDFEDFIGPIINLKLLSPEELFVLLEQILKIYEAYYNYDPNLTSIQLQNFLNSLNKRIGSDELLTPREIIKSFLSLLNILQQNPEARFEDLIQSDDIVNPKFDEDDDLFSDEFVDFEL